MKTLTWQKPGQQNVAQELIKIIINYVAELRVNRSIKEKGSLKWLYDLSFKHSNICLVSEEFKEFAENYPDLQTYNQDEYRAIKINLSESHE